MNSNSNTITSTIEIVDDGSISIDDDMHEIDYNQRTRTDKTRSNACSTSSNGTTTTTNNGTKRSKDIPPCYVCGADAHGYNFDQITCESCKAFFRRNALKPMERFRCRHNDNCVITRASRKRCKRCRLSKCFKVGMRKDWILSDEEKIIKREKIVRNRVIKQRAQLVLQQQPGVLSHSDFQTNDKSSSQVRKTLTFPFPLMYMNHPPNQHMYDRQQYFLKQLSNGYQIICQQYPQPNKFLCRSITISQTENFDSKLSLIQDITRELTQMTTSRLLNFFNLIPEFQLLTQQEKQSILIQNMLPVFMFHGALTYDPDTDTFVDRTTVDEPYDAKYLLYVYGPKVYNDFTVLARELISATYQSTNDKHMDEHAHTLFLLLMTILLFSNSFQVNSMEENQSKLQKIQRMYIDITYRFLHDQFGSQVGQRIFQNLVPLLIGLQKLCSTLANVNFCEIVEDEDKSLLSSRPITASNNSDQQSVQSSSISSSSEFSSTMISDTSHLNELQKENRTPLPFLSPTIRSSPFILSNTTTLHNYQV